MPDNANRSGNLLEVASVTQILRGEAIIIAYTGMLDVPPLGADRML
jgi:hypothetical protein